MNLAKIYLKTPILNQVKHSNQLSQTYFSISSHISQYHPEGEKKIYLLPVPKQRPTSTLLTRVGDDDVAPGVLPTVGLYRRCSLGLWYKWVAALIVVVVGLQQSINYETESQSVVLVGCSTRNKGKLQPNSPSGMMSFIGSGCSMKICAECVRHTTVGIVTALGV